MIVLHVGGRFCEEWDAGLERALRERGVAFTAADVRQVRRHDADDLLLGRLNEYTTISKAHYLAMAATFRASWPEPHAYTLYDDKWAQALFFARHGYPHPRTALVNSLGEAEKFLEEHGLRLPLVVKKREGSASRNVAKVMTFAGLPFPCLLQEFCPDNDGDYRYTVIGDQVMALKRLNRPGCFRASGSGLVVSPAELDPYCAELAHRICREHDFVTMGFDFLRDGDGRWTIAEMSYTYPVSPIAGRTGFHVEFRTGRVVPGPPDLPGMVVEQFLRQAQNETRPPAPPGAVRE